MENKTSTIVIVNVVIFLLYLKFGIMALWVPAAAGFGLICVYIFMDLIMQLYFVEFYNTKFTPAIRRITGDKLNLTSMSSEQRTIIRKGFLPTIILLAAILFGISRVIMRYQ
ncbi:MAG: hypothetical protein A2076_05445 [Geobacteraceae bacterium GWC2_53_11]|nr:MAG: hypothetical protein A2076_05445 [Geobacteraceae bacterium GWC2_53_11]